MTKPIAAKDHVSMNPFIASAIAETVAALTKHKAALAVFPDGTPEDFDYQ